jgi:hypothetical protein
LGKPIKAQPSQIASNPKPRIEQPSPKLRLGKAIKPKNTLIANNPKITNSKVKFVTLATSGGKKSLPGITAGATTGKVATKTNQSGSTPKIALREIPSDIPSIKPAPIKAEPLQARAVEISGVIQIGGKTQVIVKLPTESFSRYVEVGDRIASGSVLIKRVEGEQSLSPIVVLEEVGIEVPRQLGDGVKAPSAGDPPTSAAPQP